MMLIGRSKILKSDLASLSRLGASLLQKGGPVGFSSRALTPAESWHAHIEQDLHIFPVDFASEGFDTYLWSRCGA